MNYLAYLNAKHSKGVTKENNAVIPLIEILGPNFLTRETAKKVCERLRIAPPEEGNKHFIWLRHYAKNTLADKEIDAWDETDALEKTTTRPWNAKKHAVIANWLKVNDSALNATIEAMKRTRYYVPTASNDSSDYVATMVLPGVQACVELNKALISRAMLKLGSGDTQGAWTDLTAGRILARRIGSGYTLIERLVAIAMENQVCSACNAMAGYGKLSSAQARTFLADMQHMNPLPDIVHTIDEGERFMMLDSVMHIAAEARRKGLGSVVSLLQGTTLSKQPPKLPAAKPQLTSLDWDLMLTMMNPWYDSFISAARQRTFKARKEAFADHNRRFKQFAARVKKHNYQALIPFIMLPIGDQDAQKKKLKTTRQFVSRAVGNILLTMLMPAVDRAVVLRDRATAAGDLSVIAMALAAYRAEKKAYPDKLSQLAPEYLKKVPDDLFIDKPFGYKKTGKGYLLYSVGENMKYDGPKKNEDDMVDDIVVRVE